MGKIILQGTATNEIMHFDKHSPWMDEESTEQPNIVYNQS